MFFLMIKYMIHVKQLVQCLAYSNCPTNVSSQHHHHYSYPTGRNFLSFEGVFNLESTFHSVLVSHAHFQQNLLVPWNGF